MPIEIDPISHLATPHIAAMVAALLVAVFSVGFYLLPKFLNAQARKRYIPRIQLIAEVLVSVGLIGLVSLIGRVKLDSDAIELKRIALESERVVAKAFYPYAVDACFSSDSKRSDTPDFVATQAVCEVWSKFNYVHDVKLPWLDASARLAAVARTNGLSAKLRDDMEAMVFAIDQMQDARYNLAVVPLKRDLLTDQSSWHFVLLCALSACIGVALKCARAALQLRERRDIDP